MSTRQIKNARDLESNELIYFKSHAQATFMSDGSTVEDVINEMKEGVDVDLTDYVTTTQLNTSLSEKQDTISDLADIRSGASKGATAVQPASVASAVTINGVNCIKLTSKVPGYTNKSIIFPIFNLRSSYWTNNRRYESECASALELYTLNGDLQIYISSWVRTGYCPIRPVTGEGGGSTNPEPESGVTYNVTVPSGTHTCYIAGEMNGWSHVEMTKVDATHFTITVPTANTSMKYKYCSGPGWEYVETNASGVDIADRTYSSADKVVRWMQVYDPNP
jgi:hypothetical protein